MGKDFYASQNQMLRFCASIMCLDPGGKVRAISRGVLARGDIARDPARSRQIPWFRVRLHAKARSDGITRDLACI